MRHGGLNRGRRGGGGGMEGMDLNNNLEVAPIGLSER